MGQNELRQYFDDILNGISEEDFLSLLKEVEPFSKVGPEVLYYMQYTETFVDAKTQTNDYTFVAESEWFDPNKNLSLAA